MIVVCDEPTTGLDSFSARAVIKTLKQLAQPRESDYPSSENGNNGNGSALKMLPTAKPPKAIICSIHQPTSDVFQCFSHILLMHNGRCAFQGTTQEAADHFSRLHFAGDN